MFIKNFFSQLHLTMFSENHKYHYKANNLDEYNRTPQNENPIVKFSCRLRKTRCEAINTKGSRCARNTIKAWPYCWQHLQKINNVIISKSKIRGAGLGLFACDPSKSKKVIVFKTGDFVCQYGGDILTVSQVDNRYGSGMQTAPYAWERPDGRILDSACRRYTAAYANSQKKQDKNNVKLGRVLLKESTSDRLNLLRYRGLPDIVYGLVATKPIRNGQEIYADYGPNYWKGYVPKYEIVHKTTGISKTRQICHRRGRGRRKLQKK